MFRWVQIWQDICLPTSISYVIESRLTAEEYLTQLNKDGTSDVDPYDLLKKAYQRLWNFSEPRDTREKEAREVLFHFMLDMSGPRRFHTLKEAVQVGETTFDQSVTEARILQLCSGFLYLTTVHSLIFQGRDRIVLRWVHESARAFISSMKVKHQLNSAKTN
jgi:hypothetical protein